MAGQTREPERIAAALQLAFWGGSVKVLPRIAAASIGPNLFRAAEDPLALQTNLHAMLGLTFRLGGNDLNDLAGLSAFETLSVTVNGQTALSPQPVVTFFATLAALDPRAEQGKVAVAPADLGRRVYVREAFQELERIPGLPEPAQFFRVPQQDRDPARCAPATERAWEPPTRLLVRAPDGTDQQPQTWRPWQSLDCTLRRYRNTAVKDFAILELVPEQRAEEFYAAVATADLARDFLVAAQIVVDSAVRKVAASGPHGPETLTFLGAFWLPWDAHRDLTQTAGVALKSRRTVLFVGKLPAKERVNLMRPVGNALTLSLVEPPMDASVEPESEQKGRERQMGALGRRWELRDGLPASEFDTLQCTSDLPAGLNPSLCFPTLLEFSFAQSIGVVEVEAAATHGEILDVMDAARDAYREELLNFNALNLYVDGELQNPFSQVLPVSRDPRNQQRIHRFVTRAAQPVVPESFNVAPAVAPYLPLRYRRLVPDVPAFFDDLYKRMGRPRGLELRLEHTLGLELARPQADPLNAATRGDFRVVLPTDVALRLAGADGRPGIAAPFVSIIQYAPPAQGTERLTLAFEASWLAAPDPRDREAGKKENVRVLAWRSVAELAHARSIRLQPRYCTFDFADARGAAEHGPQVLGNGLTWHGGAAWDVTAEVQQRCRRWLSGQQLQDGELTVSRPAPALPGTALFLEWELLVTRTPERSPDAGSPWDVHWRPVPPWRLGRPPAADEATVKPAMNLWLNDLRERCAVIAAKRSPDQQERITRAAALLSTKARASNGWFVVGSCADDDGSASATLCPVAFAPLARDPQLGDQTVEVVTHFFDLLADQLLEPGWEVKNADANVQKLVEGWAKQVSAIETLIDSALGGLAPTPPEGDATLSAVQSAPAGPLHPSVVEAVRGRLWQDPRNYGSIKSFLVTLLTGGTLAAPARLPAQLLALLSRREEVTFQRTDAVSSSFFQAQEMAAGASHLRFVDPLDDARYDSAFTVPASNGLTWRALEDELAAVFAQRCTVARTVDRLLPQRDATNLRLPSRRSLIRPANIFCGYIEALQRTAPTAGSVDRKLLEGTWIAPGGGELVLVGTASKIRRSNRPDQAVFSMLYWVAGDEEITEGFAHDQFFLQEVAGTTPPPPEPTDGQQAGSFWAMLQFDPKMKNLETLLEQANLDTVRAALGNLAKDEAGELPPAPTFSLERQGKRVRINGLPEGVEVAAFEPKGPGRQGGANSARLLLLVNTRVSVWKPVAYRLIQTRNRGKHFHPKFFQSALAGGQPFAYQRTVAHNDTAAPPIDLGGRRQLSLADLLTRTLGPRHFGGQPKPSWTDFDLSVTVRHHQMVHWMIAGADQLRPTEIGGRKSTHRASFPLLNHRHRGGDAATASIEWFPRPYREFLVDFQWSSRTNLQFLRIDNVRVTVT
jgi:hypothetical protein